jgi:hypothetical protein
VILQADVNVTVRPVLRVSVSMRKQLEIFTEAL